MEPQWINIHTHRKGPGICIVDNCPGEIAPADCGPVYFSMGIHPMFINDDVQRRLAEIESKAVAGQIVAIGEAGLDRNSGTLMSVQAELFRQQVIISEKYELPMIIHCVKSFPELITVYKEMRPRQAWIIHGFNNRKEILLELLRHGFYISAGKQVVNEVSNIFRLLPDIPLNRLFIETDDSDWGIEVIYGRVAAALHISEQDLRECVCDNFFRTFKV